MDFRNPSLCATPSIGQPLLIVRFARSAGAIIRWKLARSRWAAFHVRAHGGKNPGKGEGRGRVLLYPPSSMHVCTYTRVLRISGRGWRARGARAQPPNQAGPTSSFAVPQPGIYRGEQIVGEAFSLLSWLLFSARGRLRSTFDQSWMHV